MAATSDDPKRSAYEAVRAHERMLNEAASRFEHARLAPLIALNGGAVVAYLTLLGALMSKDSGSHPSLWLSALAVGAWVLGLVAAALATAAATGQQQAISAAHRLLREELEAALIDEPRVTAILKGPSPTVAAPSPGGLVKWTPNGPPPVVRIVRWWTGWLAEGSKDQDEAPEDDSKRQRRDLRGIGSLHAQRLKARWWLSVAMFVTGAVLALAAISLGTGVG